MPTTTFDVKDQTTPVVNLIDRAIKALGEGAEETGKAISRANEAVEESYEQVEHSVRAVDQAERRQQELREQTVKQAQQLANAELYISQAREQAAKAANAQADAERNLNRQRESGFNYAGIHRSEGGIPFERYVPDRGGAGRGGGGGSGGGGAGADPGGDAFDLSAAFERTAQDIIRQDRHLTSLLRQERDTRIRNERQAQAEVDKLIEDGNRRRLETERRTFAQNRINRERDLKDRQKNALAAVDLLFQSDKQTRQIQERSARETRKYTEQQAREVARATRIIEVGLLELFFTLHSLGKPIEQLTNYLQDFVVANIQASAEVEKFSSTLTIASGSLANANIFIGRLLDITTELAAIDTGSLIQFASRLQTAGLSAREAEDALVAVTRRMEEQGKGTAQTARVLEQFVQAINANVITMQDFRPILREYPLLYRDFSDALGVTITDLDSFRSAAEGVGGATEAIVQGLSHVAQVAQGARIDTINRQLDEFNDRIFVLRAALGDALRPAVVSVLQWLNRMLARLEDVNIATRTFIGVLSLATITIGKLSGAFIQLGIIAIVGAQMQGATLQIANMTASLNSAVTALGGTAAAAAELPRHLQTAARVTSVLSRVLPILVGSLIAVGIAASATFAVLAHLTEHINESRKEYDAYISTLNSLPNAVKGGEDAIKRQIQTLIDYRKNIVDTRRELERQREEEVSRRRELAFISPDSTFFDDRFTGDRGLSKRLQDLASQAEITRQNIEDLGIAFDVDVSGFVREVEISSKTLQDITIEIDNAISSISDFGNNAIPVTAQTEALRRVVGRMQDEFILLRDGTEDAQAQARSLGVSIVRLIENFIDLQQVVEPEVIRNYEAELIKLDFAIRRLEGSIGRLDIEDFIDKFGGISGVGNIEKLFQDLTDSLAQEAEIQIRIAESQAKERGDTEQELNNEILRINERLAFDLEELERKKQGVIDKINEESSDRRVSRIARYLRFEQAAVEARIKAERQAAEAIKEAERGVIRGINGRRKLINEGLIPAQFKAFSEAVVQYAIMQGSIGKVNENIRETIKLYGEQLEAFRAFRRESDETERFRFERPQGDTRESGLPAAGVDTPTETRDPDDLTGEFGNRLEEIEKITDAVIRAARDIDRENERLVRRFSRGFSRALTDFIFDGEATFQEFLLEFAKTTTQIIIQSKIEAEILKRIDDDVTQHRINNMRRVVEARARQGLTIENLTPDVISSIVPTSGLLSGLSSGGLGSIALVGLAIAPILVRAIREGFDDTTVELDKREVGKITASSVRELVKEGKVRL